MIHSPTSVSRLSARLAFVLVTLCSPVLAQTDAPDQHPIEAELSRCMETPEGMSTQGMRECMDVASASWDQELNRIWGELMRELAGPGRDSLRASQRKWIAFRDAELEALAQTYGAMQGSMYTLMHADAVSSLTRDRVRQLDGLLEAQLSSAQ